MEEFWDWTSSRDREVCHWLLSLEDWAIMKQHEERKRAT